MLGAAAQEVGEAGRGVGFAGGSAARAAELLRAAVGGTPPGVFRGVAVLAENDRKLGLLRPAVTYRSRAGAKNGRRARRIRENIIGHGFRFFGAAAPGGAVFAAGRRGCLAIVRGRALALLHQPAGQHGGGVFLEPGIQQLRNLLAEIGRVAQAGKLVTLQGIAGRREQKVPGRLDFALHRALREERLDDERVVNTVNSTHVLTNCGKVCKSFAWNSKRIGYAHSALGAFR